MFSLEELIKQTFDDQRAQVQALHRAQLIVEHGYSFFFWINAKPGFSIRFLDIDPKYLQTFCANTNFPFQHVIFWDCI